MLQLWLFANTLLWQFNIELFGLKLGLNVALLAIVGAVWIWKRQGISSYSVKVLFAFAALLLFYYLVAIAGPCTDLFQKAIFSGPILLFLTLVGVEAGWRATESDWIKLQSVAVWILLLAFLGFAVEILVPDAFPSTAIYRDEGKFSGIYSEPSFVAYSLFPCVLMLLEAQSKQLRLIGVLALCGLLLLSRSSTLIALIAAWILYRIIKQRNLVNSIYIALGGTLIIGLAAILNYDLLVEPTLVRITGIVGAEGTKNLSSLAYLQGLQDAWDNLLRTNGFGVGINMMGCNPLPDVPAREAIAKVFGVQINSEDGTTVFSKLISETGVFGLLFFVTLVWWWIKTEKITLGSGYDLQNQASSVQLTLVLSFVATSLIRSPGYFSGSFFLLVVAVAAIVKWKKNRLIRLSTGQNVQEHS